MFALWPPTMLPGFDIVRDVLDLRIRSRLNDLRRLESGRRKFFELCWSRTRAVGDPIYFPKPTQRRQ